MSCRKTLSRMKLLLSLIAALHLNLWLHGGEEASVIHQWTFDAKNLKNFNNRGTPSGPVSLEIQDKNILKFTHHRSDKDYGVIYNTLSGKATLPDYFILRANLAGQKLVAGNFSIMVRGTWKQGAVVWKLKVPATLTEKATLDILCQSPSEIESLSLYLETSGPALEGELLLRSVELLKPPAPVPFPEVTTFQTVKNPGFEQPCQYPGDINSGWAVSENGITQIKREVADGKQYYMEVTKGFLRQRFDVHFPQKYLITFHAKVTGRLSLLAREDNGASIDILSVKPELLKATDGTKPETARKVSDGNVIREDRDKQAGWKKFSVVYPVLQENAKNMYIQFDGDNFLLDDVEVYPLSHDHKKLNETINKYREELRSLLSANPDKFPVEAKAFEAASKDFDSQNGLYPDDYLMQITKLLQKVKMGLIVE